MKMNPNTVEWALLSMRFMPYTHIVVRQRGEHGIEALGGSCCLDDIIKRFGKMELERSFVAGDILFVDVKKNFL